VTPSDAKKIAQAVVLRQDVLRLGTTPPDPKNWIEFDGARYIRENFVNAELAMKSEALSVADTQARTSERVIAKLRKEMPHAPRRRTP
jgi:hypothetical protein